MCSESASPLATPSATNRIREQGCAAIGMELLYSEVEKQRPTTLLFRVWGPRLLVLADLRFVDGLFQMLDRLYAVSVEIMLCGFELMLGIAHRFKSFVDVGMRFRRSCAGWHGRKSCYGWNRRGRRLWSG